MVVKNTSFENKPVIKKKKDKQKSSNISKLVSTPTLKNGEGKVVKIIDRNAKPIVEEKKNLTRFEKKQFARSGVISKKKKDFIKDDPPLYFKYPPYKPIENIDYNAVICISSYNRYSKVKEILQSIYSQESKYKYKVILMNDGSDGTVYHRFKKAFPKLEYVQNNVNGGKKYYWRTVSRLWGAVKKYKTHCLIQMDDDFQLCDNFLDILLDKFYEIKEKDNGYMAMRYHQGSFDINSHKTEDFFNDNIRYQKVDGGSLFDIQFIKKINYEIEDQSQFITELSDSFVWRFLNKKVRENGIRVFTMKHSLVYHDGNFDSKLNPKIRKIKKYYTKKFIDEKGE